MIELIGIKGFYSMSSLKKLKDFNEKKVSEFK